MREIRPKPRVRVLGSLADEHGDDMSAIPSVDTDGWKSALPQIKDHYATFGAKLPARLVAQLDQLAGALS